MPPLIAAMLVQHEWCSPRRVERSRRIRGQPKPGSYVSVGVRASRHPTRMEMVGMRRRIGLTVAVNLLLVAAACGSGDAGDRSGSSAGPAEGSSEPPTSAVTGGGAGRAGATATPTASGGRGCPDNGGRVPDGAVTAEVVDVDGDGRRDQVWHEASESGQRVGLSTASGAVVGSQVDTGRPVSGVLVVDADQRGPVEVLVNKGDGISLLVFQRCDLVPVIGPDGDPYLFDAGYFGNGTGVTCTDVDGDGRRDLVGMNLGDYGAVTAGTFPLSRTVVELDGATARHGHHDETSVRLDPSEAHRYYGIRCGPLSLTTEMLTR